MIIDRTAADPAFREGPLPDIDLRGLIDAARARLGFRQRWSLVSARRKLGKALFEMEDGNRRLIAIVNSSGRTAHAFESLRSVWAAGMRPPAMFTVVEPAARVPELNLTVMEKAPGDLLWQTIERGSEYALEHTAKAAQWLVALHGLSLEAPAWGEDRSRIERWSSQLAAALPQEAARIRVLLQAIFDRLPSSAGPIPSHGDFHPGNVFVASGTRVTVIDLDKFGQREREFDAGYFLVQTACMGFWARGSFDWTLPVRERFLEVYERRAGVALRAERMSLHMAATLLQNLNYDPNVFKTGRVAIAPTFLDMAEKCLFEQDIALRIEAAAL